MDSAKAGRCPFTSGGKRYALEVRATGAGMPSTPAGGLEFDLVWADTGTAADFVGRDVKGKAVLIQDILTPGVLNRSINNEGAVQRAIDAGAAAVGMIYGISDNFTLWEGARDRPGFNVGYEDGKMLRDLLGKGAARQGEAQGGRREKSGLKTASVLGTLPGTTDEEISVIAHMDAYFDGAHRQRIGRRGDDGTAGALREGARRRSGGATSASWARPAITAARASWLHEATRDGADEDRAHDQPRTRRRRPHEVLGQHICARAPAVSPMRWWVWGSKRLLDIALTSFSHFNVGITADMDNGASGEIGRLARDAPSMQVITSPEAKHTEQDTPEWVPAERARAGRARLRADHRRGEQAGSPPDSAGGGPTDHGWRRPTLEPGCHCAVVAAWPDLKETTMRFRFVRAVGAFVVASLVAVAASAQTVGVGSILGRITDETGALLPGVTVTIKSPSLQLPQLDTPDGRRTALSIHRCADRHLPGAVRTEWFPDHRA